MSEQGIKSVELKVVESQPRHGLLLGYALVSKITKSDGSIEDYYDLAGDNAPDEAIIDAIVEFSKSPKPMLVQHGGLPVGKVDFLFPLTEDVAKSMGIQAERYGLLCGMVPEDPRVVKLVDMGLLKGFSIGFVRIEDEDIES